MEQQNSALQVAKKAWKEQVPSVIYLTLGLEAILFLLVLISGLRPGGEFSGPLDLHFILMDLGYIGLMFLFPLLTFSIVVRLPSRNVVYGLVLTLVVLFAVLFLFGNILIPPYSGAGALLPILIIWIGTPIAIILGFVFRLAPKLPRFYQLLLGVLSVLFLVWVASGNFFH